MNLVRHQFRYDLLTFRRNAQGRFFTLALPVIFLVIFATVFGNDTTVVGGHHVKQTTYYVPAILALAVVSAAFSNLIFSVVVQRESGILKRRRSSPVPAWALLASRSLVAVWVTLVSAVILWAVGKLAYGVTLHAGRVPAVLLALVVGALSFCALGYAVASFVSSEDSAQPLVQLVTLPLFFASGVFIPAQALPSVVVKVADVFPVRHLDLALLAPFDPARSGPAIEWGHLGVVALWGIAGVAVALRRFSWSPRGG